MREIRQDEAVEMREALKVIASYRNDAGIQDGAQGAAKLARETLLRLDLMFERDLDSPAASRE